MLYVGAGGDRNEKTDGARDAAATLSLTMNPEDFARLDRLGEELDCALALNALADHDVDSLPSEQRNYDTIVNVFTEALTIFRDQRDALPSDRLIRKPSLNQFRAKALDVLGGTSDAPALPLNSVAVRLPRRMFLLLIPGKDLLTSYSDGGVPRFAARVIVGSCGPRFRRALRIIRVAANACERAALHELAEEIPTDEPRAGLMRGGPYR